MPVPRIHILAAAIAALLVLALGASAASASRAPTRAESTAIKKAFFATHATSRTTVTRIRVSTVDQRFSAVSYTSNVPDGQVATARAAKVYRPAPVMLRKGSTGKWKAISTGTAPAKVRSDLNVRSPRSDIRITGEVDATLTRAARCTAGGGSASIYDPASDLYLSIQFHQDAYTGPGFYPALGVRSLAGLYTSQATVLQWQTGQGNDAFAPSGTIYVEGGWGLIEATMARVADGQTHPQSISVSGTWACA